MFLIRTAFWLAIVVMLLPTNDQEQRNIFGVVKAAAKDVGGFCARNPETCEQGQRAFSRFGEKAEFGAKLIWGFFQNQSRGKDGHLGETAYSFAPTHSVPLGSPSSQLKSQPIKGLHTSSANTLRNDDLVPAWGFSSTDAGA